MSPAGSQVRAAIARHCATVRDSRALRAQVLNELRRVIPLDWYVWIVTDPRSEVGVDPLAEVPELRILPTIVRLKYATAINRWTGLTSAASLDANAAESPLRREVQRSAGAADVRRWPSATGSVAGASWTYGRGFRSMPTISGS